jgi:polyhydroxybutyrate depolymerase
LPLKKKWKRFVVVLSVVLSVVVAMLGVTVLVAFTGRDRAVLLGRPSTMEFDGLRRTYRVNGPKGASSKPKGLVIALHGFGGDGRQLAYYTALHNAFPAEMVVAYADALSPTQQGLKTGWNAQFCCGSGWKEKADDVGFLRALITRLTAEYGVPADRVFIVGFSNGAFMAQRFAAENPTLVRALAVGSGTIGTVRNSLKPTGPVPILLMHGAKDQRVRYEGGMTPGDPEFDWIGFDGTVDAWRAVNRCNEIDSAKVARTDARVTTIYDGCAVPMKTIEYLNNAHKWDGWRITNVWTRVPGESREVAAFFARF